MSSPASVFIVRLLPVILVSVAASAYIVEIEGNNAYPLRNIVPMLAIIVLSAITLIKGAGRWTGSGWCWPLGTLGFAIPAMGLSLYLHYGYAVDLNGMYSESVYPRELFRYLPGYTIFAGGIGFAIGWIAGRNI
jgi:hypothetical protein